MSKKREGENANSVIRKFRITAADGKSYLTSFYHLDAIIAVVYLVKETKGTKDSLKLRSSERDKVDCGKKHFDALGVSFAVVVSADEV
jgi:restriction endonuclease